MAKLPKAKIIKGKKPKANNKYKGFDEEYTLAQLIQNAAARGLMSARGYLFARRKGQEIMADTSPSGLTEKKIIEKGGALLKEPPTGTNCACALGAQALTPKIKRPITTILAATWNDSEDDEIPTYTVVEEYADKRSANIGAAYEQALRNGG